MSTSKHTPEEREQWRQLILALKREDPSRGQNQIFKLLREDCPGLTANMIHRVLAQAKKRGELPRPQSTEDAPTPSELVVPEVAEAAVPATASTSRLIYDVPIVDIIVEERYRKDLGNLDALTASLRDSPSGMLQPIILSSHKKLIAGQRRLEAAKRLGWDVVPCVIAESLDDALTALRAERDENTCRKPFEPSEAVALGKAIEDLEKPKAKQRQKAKLKKGTAAPVVENCHHGESKGKTRDKVAEAVGLSGRTYEKAKAVVEAAEQEPERFADVVEEMDATGKVDPAYREVRRRQQGELFTEGAAPTPTPFPEAPPPRVEQPVEPPASPPTPFQQELTTAFQAAAARFAGLTTSLDGAEGTKEDFDALQAFEAVCHLGSQLAEMIWTQRLGMPNFDKPWSPFSREQPSDA